MSKEYPFIPEHLIPALEDTSIPLIDLMHSHLKLEMLDCEEAMNDSPSAYLEGYMDAMVSMYCLTYNLSIDRANLTSQPA